MLKVRTIATPELHSKVLKRKNREITLTIGLFFDSTGNNAINSSEIQTPSSTRNSVMDDSESESVLGQWLRLSRGNAKAGSYLRYYTNIHWLKMLYSQDLIPDTGFGQCAIYIDGIGTEAGAADNIYGMWTGRGDTGVINKTDKAVEALTSCIKCYLTRYDKARYYVIKELQFDIFGFSRGAAAARHFANRVFRQDHVIIAAIKAGMEGHEFSGIPGGKTRFLGIFDTVAAISTLINGLDPHNSDTGDVNLMLHSSVAEKVFHITAQHECRFNFALNSIKPTWPELALPGVHSDIGGGYPPEEREAYFLTRPQFETIERSRSDTETLIYQQAREQLCTMNTYPTIAPLLHAAEVNIDVWHDARMPYDQYSTPQKRSGAAVVIDRLVHNDWSRVVLRVMLDAAKDAGVIFDPIQDTNVELEVRSELKSLCKKAIAMGRATRYGQKIFGFTTTETEILAEKYIHCSANWNSVIRDGKGSIVGGVRPIELVSFTNRPDKCWQRTTYDMNRNKVWK